MVAFAANSLLCRLALQHGSIDAASFSSIRLLSGALTLAAIVRLRATPAATTKPDWMSAAMLFAYVACFSFAYLSLAAGTGALILSVLLAGRARADATGGALAIASGALTSGIGYVVWYAALRGLTALRAATVQLSVPPLAAFGGVLWLGETITPRLVGASIAI